MADSTSKIKPAPNSTHTPFEKMLGRLSTTNYVNLDDLTDQTETDKFWAALSGDPKRLDTGDLFYALAHPQKFFFVPEVGNKIREHLGFRANDKLTFDTIALSPVQQVAITIVHPEKLNPEVPTLVFGTGLGHSSALYIPDMAKRADRLGCRVVLFDQPGNGASQSSTSTDSSNFYEALKAVIVSEVPEGEKYSVAGHSLGSNPADQLYKDIYEGRKPVGERTLVRLLTVNAVPTRFQELSDIAKISREFISTSLWSEITNGLEMKITSAEKFDDLHSEIDRERSRSIIKRERVQINLLGIMNIFASMDMNDEFPQVGLDPRLAVLMTRDDKLMNWDTRAFEGKRGYHVVDGDHGACIVGEEGSEECSLAIDRALTEDPSPGSPLLTTNDAYRGADTIVRLGLNSTFSSPSLSVSPELALKLKLFAINHSLGVFIKSGFSFEMGRNFGKDDSWRAMSFLAAELGVETFRFPVELRLGAQAGNAFTEKHEKPLEPELTATMSFSLARFCDIEAGPIFSLDGDMKETRTSLKLHF